MSDVYQLLENWGRWARDRCLPRGVKCGIAIIMDQNVGSTVDIAPANDELAQSIEPVLRILKHRKPDHYRVIELYYRDACSTRLIAKRLGKSNGWASDTLRAGEAWVDGAINGN